MKKLIGLLLIFISVNSFAQKGSIKGNVIFKLDSLALPGATITISGTRTGTQADINGKFELSDLSPGKYDLVLQSIGYGKDTITNVLVNENRATKLVMGLPAGPCYEKTDSKKCPVDGISKNVIPILYGLPGRKLMRKMEKGKVKLGGCEVTGCEPNWFCKEHQLEF